MRRNTVRDVATVTVSEPVRTAKRARKSGPRNGAVETVVTVDARVLAAAHAALRPGERLVIVSPGVMVTVYED